MDKAKPDGRKKQLQHSINSKKSDNQIKKEVIRCESWNIRRGVWKQEIEVKIMVQKRWNEISGFEIVTENNASLLVHAR